MSASFENPKLQALSKIKGLTIGDALAFFDAKATERDKKIVALVETEDEAFECDNLITSEGDDNGAYVLGWRWVPFAMTEFDKECSHCGELTEKVIDCRDGTKEALCKDCLEQATCPGCGVIEGTEEWGTVGDGFDGYCPSCADKREDSGEVETG